MAVQRFEGEGKERASFIMHVMCFSIPRTADVLCKTEIIMKNAKMTCLVFNGR